MYWNMAFMDVTSDLAADIAKERACEGRSGWGDVRKRRRAAFPNVLC